MNGSLRVSPEKLSAAAQKFNSSAATVQRITQNMTGEVKALNHSWAGEAASAYYRKVEGLQESINKMVRMIQEHSTDLEAMSQNYKEAEKKNEEKAQSLKTDVIV